MKKISVAAFQIKMIALILMVFDHVREFSSDSPLWFNYLGRVAAPLFIFILVWSIDYTHDRRRFLLRLYRASIGMILVWEVGKKIKLKEWRICGRMRYCFLGLFLLFS